MARAVLIVILSSFAVASGFLFKPRRPLAIDGGWSTWESWTKCSLNSVNNSNFFPEFNGFEVRSRKRVCDSPAPVQGGKPCFGSAFRYKQCGCTNPLGMQSGRIQNYQLYSNSRIFEDFNVSKARFGNQAAWCSDDQLSPFLNIFYQIDLVNFTTVASIATAGIREGRVSRFRLYHSLNGKKWTQYSGKRQVSTELIGNILPNRVKVNTFDDPLIARFLKIVPLHSYNKVCMKFEVYGCVFTCGKEMTTGTGEIIGRSAETHDQNCLWKIDVKNTTKINLDFVIFDVPCSNGFLEIRDGTQSYSQSNMIKRYCGDDLALGLLKVPSNALWLNFVSNSSSEEIGFRVRYISECSENLKMNQNEILKIHSPNYPLDYFDNNDCVWNVSSDSNKIFVLFKAFDIEPSKTINSQECLNDFVLLERIDGKGKSHGGQRYCNSRKPPTHPTPIVFETKKLSIRFKSDDVITGKGFLIELTSYDPSKGIPTTKPSNGAMTTKHPRITSLGSKDDQVKTTKSVIVKSKIVTSRFSASYSPKSNNMTINGSQVKKKSKDEPDWTIITVASFSCFVFILIVFVTVISIRKCTSRYHGESGKFLPAISKKVPKDSQNETNKMLQKSKKSFPVPESSQQFCEVKSPAGSIEVPHSSAESDSDEQQPMRADIVNHTLRQDDRKIDMYTDGEQFVEQEALEAHMETLGPDSIIEETVI